MIAFILFVAVQAPDAVYVLREPYDSRIECEQARYEIEYRAELTKTTQDILINQCLPETGYDESHS